MSTDVEQRPGSPLVTRYGVETIDEPGMVPFIAHALANRAPVVFSMDGEGAPTLFTLHPFGPAVHVRGPGGEHRGTFGDVGAAVSAGWSGCWWWGW